MISLSSLRGWPYPDYGKGIWGEPTVTLNFCEEASLRPHRAYAAAALLTSFIGLRPHILLCRAL